MRKERGKQVGFGSRSLLVGCALVLCTMVVCGIADAGQCVKASRIAIGLPENADDLEMRVANVLKERILKRSDVSVEITKGAGDAGDLPIYLGRTGHEESLDKICAAYGVKLPGRQRPAPEGYAVKTIRVNGSLSVLAVGADNRGTLYAVGEVLRQLTYNPTSVSIGEVDVSTAPAYRYRGSSANQGGGSVSHSGFQ